MSTHFVRHVGAALVTLASTAVLADSFASSASSAGSKSVGSLSDSIGASSNSSSPDKKAAAGHYRIEQVAELADKPTHLRLHLMALDDAAAAGALWLDLPRAAVQAQQLAVHAVIELRQRPYGMEVAHGASTQHAGRSIPPAVQGAAQTTAPTIPNPAFFLLLADDWRQALETRAVTL